MNRKRQAAAKLIVALIFDEIRTLNLDLRYEVGTEKRKDLERTVEAFLAGYEETLK